MSSIRPTPTPNPTSIPPAPPHALNDQPHQAIAGLPPEEPVWAGRASLRGFVPQYAAWAFLLVALLVLLHYLGVKFNLPVQWKHHGYVALAMLAILAVMVVRQMIDLYTIRYRLTTQRLFIERGILDKVTDQIELVRVDDVGVVERLVPRLLGLGDVILNTTDVNERNPVIRNIAGPNAIAEQIRTNVRNMRQIQRMIYTENVGQHDVGPHHGGDDSLLTPPN